MRRLSLKNLLEKLDLRLRQRIPVIHQTESSECGLASLAMISAHYGKSIDLISLRQQFNLSARGATLAGLTGIAAELGMTTRALSLDMDDLPNPAATVYFTLGFQSLSGTGENQRQQIYPARPGVWSPGGRY